MRKAGHIRALRQGHFAQSAVVIVLLTMIPAAGVLAQSASYGTGMMLDDEAYQQAPLAAPLMRGDYVELPVRASLKAYAPRPGNQGNSGTCVGWSTAYGARTIVAALENGWTDTDEITAKAFSPSYIYNQLKPATRPDVHCTYGTLIPYALTVLQSNGAASLADFPFVCDRTVTDADHQAAAPNTILDYTRLFNTKSRNKVLPVKKSLSEQKPVVIGMRIVTSFFNVGSSGVWNPKGDEEADTGGHAMTVVGYDDEMHGGAFEVLNSWGTGWGDGGYVWVPYDAFAQYVKYAFEVYAAPGSLVTEIPLAGSLSLTLDIGDPIDVTWAGDRYRTREPLPSWTSFSAFVTNREPAYVYAFGSDLARSSARLVPRTTEYSAYLPYPGSHIPLPDEDSYMETDDRTGTDFLVLLYSAEPLDLDSLITAVDRGAGTFRSRLMSALGSRAIPNSAVQFSADSIGFSASSTTGTVVPVVIEIDHVAPAGVADLFPPKLNLIGQPVAFDADGTASWTVDTLPDLLEGAVQDESGVASFAVNGDPVYPKKDGHFSLPVDGRSAFTFAATDHRGNGIEYRLAFDLRPTDAVPPTLTVLSPPVVPGGIRGVTVVTGQRRITVTGAVEDASGVASVFVNGVAAEVGDDGSYAAEISVPTKRARLKVRAVDTRGNGRDTMFLVLDDDDNADTLKASAAYYRDMGDYVAVDVFYGTDRARTGDPEPATFYGGDRGTQVEYGTASVSIPKGHSVGELESPVWWKFQFREDPAEHVVLLSVQPQNPATALAAMRNAVARSTRRDAFVFVHGYNVTFSEAARRTAQLAYDLGFEGAPIFYSWPSDGQVARYMADEVDVDWTGPNLREFLEDVATKTGAEHVHVIAHSMGNRAVTKALSQIAESYDRPLFDQVILAAPDIDAAVFTRDIAPAIPGAARRVTLYASSKDKALMFSKKLHGYPRAGDSGAGLIVSELIDTIDASGIDTDLLGHGYFAETSTLLQDMLTIMTSGVPPSERNLLERVRALLKYWLIPGG